MLKAVERDLAAIRKLDKALSESGLAATAKALAEQLDDADTPATAKASCARSLTGTLVQLRELTPKPDPKDGLDDISRAREARRAKLATA